MRFLTEYEISESEIWNFETGRDARPDSSVPFYAVFGGEAEEEEEDREIPM